MKESKSNLSPADAARSLRFQGGLDGGFERGVARTAFPDDFPGAIHQERLRNSRPAIAVSRLVAFHPDGIIHRRALDEFFDALPVLFGKAQNLETLARVFFLKLVQMRNTLQARPAPGGPEFDQHHL